MRIIRLDEVPPQPWRNGGGSTQELLTWPTVTDWLLRISVACIDASGPFSAYPGIERWFAVVSGEGVVLRFAGRRALLSAGSEPVRFEGAAAPQCELLDGPTQDLNLMVKSEAGRGRMAVAVAGEDWISSAAVRAVYTAEAALLWLDTGEKIELPAGSLAFGEQAAHQCWRMQASAGGLRAWWLQFKERES